MKFGNLKFKRYGMCFRMQEGAILGTEAAPQGNGVGEGEGSFSIPDEYCEKDWVKNFEGQSGDDLKNNIFKALDEKYANNPIIPKSADEYALNDILKDEEGNIQFEYPENILETFGDKFRELGLTKEQGQGILKKYTDFEIEEFQKYTNPEELEQSIRKIFNQQGSEKSQERKDVEALIKEFLPEECQKFLQKTAPNYTIEMFYLLAKGFVEKYAFKEGSQAAGISGNMRMTEAERDEEYNRLCQKMQEIKSRPHTTKEKEDIQKQIIALFEQK